MKTLLFFLGVVAIPAGLLAQQAEISGYVKDSSGTAVPEASVKTVSVDRGWNRSTTSNREGIYSIPGLDPGKYELHAEKPGFQALVRENVILQVAQRATVDLELKVGDVTQVITVAAGTPLINATDASVGVENMPLNGRSSQTLFQLTPGVVIAPATNVSPGQFSVNGQRTNSNYPTVDGVSANIGVAAAASLAQTGSGA